MDGLDRAERILLAENGSAGFASIRLLFRKPLVAVFAMCGGILLLACLNLASLLMARGAARQNELATRLALGATRRRLVQQLLVESLLIALVGTALGLAISPLVEQVSDDGVAGRPGRYACGYFPGHSRLRFCGDCGNRGGAAGGTASGTAGHVGQTERSH